MKKNIIKDTILNKVRMGNILCLHPYHVFVSQNIFLKSIYLLKFPSI